MKANTAQKMKFPVDSFMTKVPCMVNHMVGTSVTKELMISLVNVTNLQKTADLFKYLMRNFISCAV